MFTYIMTSQLQADIERFDEVAARLDVVSVLPRTWSGRVRRDLQAEAIGASVAMEGVNVTVEEVRRILAGDNPREVSEQDAALVRGYREAMQFVLSRADDPAFAWNAEIFRTIDASAMARSWAERAGLYRDRQVWITNSASGEQVYLPPANEDVSVLIDQLAEWLEHGSAGTPALVRAALAHIWLAAVHPFRDGNGRTARITASLVMYRAGYRLPYFTSLEEWWGCHTQDYYRAFECLGESWSPDTDVTPFIEAHAAAQRQQADALSLKDATERLLWSALEDVVAYELGMDTRAANALWEAFFGRTVTNRYYRGIVDVSPVVASLDLKQLQTSGLIAAIGDGRNRSYIGTLPLVRRIVELFSLPIDVSGSGPVDQDLRSSTIAALAKRVTGAA